MRDATLISVLLDRSGSMNDVKAETISGFNFFLKEQQEAEGVAHLSLVQFDSQGIDSLYTNTPIGEVKPLDSTTYQPRASTPLLDALGQTIIGTGKFLADTPDAERPDKVVFVVITDGLENASREFTRERIREMIKTQTEVYKWQFVYLGANQDAFAEGERMAMAAANVANYNVQNMGEVYDSVSANIRSYRRTGRASDLAFSGRQRARMGGGDKPKQ